MGENRILYFHIEMQYKGILIYTGKDPIGKYIVLHQIKLKLKDKLADSANNKLTTQNVTLIHTFLTPLMRVSWLERFLIIHYVAVIKGSFKI